MHLARTPTIRVDRLLFHGLNSTLLLGKGIIYIYNNNIEIGNYTFTNFELPIKIVNVQGCVLKPVNILIPFINLQFLAS